MAPQIQGQNKARFLAKNCCFKWLCFEVILLLVVSGHVASFITVKSLPGFSGPLPFKLETGYIGVDEKDDVQIFYYFIESEENPGQDPLVLWLTGGPGCSAISGLVFEIGPVRFNMVEYNGSLPTLMSHLYSWTKVASIIFLDAPVGTGFSYARSLESSDSICSRRMYDFLRKWLQSHPQFLENPVYIGGDSYAGMIVPVVAKHIADGSNVGHKPSINLKGYLLGNPGTDRRFDANSKIPFAHRMAFISDELYKSARKNCHGNHIEVDTSNIQCKKDLQSIDKCIKQINEPHVLEPVCKAKYWAVNKLDVNRRMLEGRYEVSEILPEDFPKFGCRGYNSFLCTIWANDQRVQKALGVRKGTINAWMRCNRSLPYTRDISSTVNYHQHLNAGDYRALIYSGDHEMVIPYMGTQSWIKTLNLSIVMNRQPWLVDGEVAGYWREYANHFTFATVKGAGHTVPEYQPKESFAMFKRWISHQPL